MSSGLCSSLTGRLLASKIGAALVRTHDYAKAINYFEAAVRNGMLKSQTLSAMYYLFIIFSIINLRCCAPLAYKILFTMHSSCAGQSPLRYDLAELYLRLSQLDKAEKVLRVLS